MSGLDDLPPEARERVRATVAELESDLRTWLELHLADDDPRETLRLSVEHLARSLMIAHAESLGFGTEHVLSTTALWTPDGESVTMSWSVTPELAQAIAEDE